MKLKTLLVRIAIIVVAATMVLLANLFFSGRMSQLGGEGETPMYYMAKVVSVDSVTNVDPFETGSATTKIVIFTAQITSKGAYKDRMVQAEQVITSKYNDYFAAVKEGDIVSLFSPPTTSLSQEKLWHFDGFYRLREVIIICIIFIVFLLLIGGFKGFTSLCSLIITFGAIFLVYLPAILSGYNIYILTLSVGMFCIVGGLLIIDGPSQKTFAAILGNVSGLVVVGILAYFINRWMGISGVIDEEYEALLWISDKQHIDLRALVWGAMLIGSLGAVMDVCMSIASALQEISESAEITSFKKLFTSGMNIGRDAIGTMTNTLVLAYIGSSLALVLLLIFYNSNLMRLLSNEMILVEILQAIVGSLGILVAVPLTALSAAYIFSGKHKKAPPTYEEYYHDDEDEQK